MNTHINLPTNKVTISPVGMEITNELSLEEWSQLAGPIGHTARSVAFIIGDWLIYGQKTFGAEKNGTPAARVASDQYDLSLANTDLDLTTLQNYAYVSRKVPLPIRSEQLSWEHHKILAKLPEAEQRAWIKRCLEEEEGSNRMSTRRLRKSLALGRIATQDDLEPDPADKGIETHIPFVNRLVGWWRGMQDDEFLTKATPEQRDALKRDLAPVVEIYEQL